MQGKKEGFHVNSRGITKRRKVLRGSISVFDLSQQAVNVSEEEYNRRKQKFMEWAKMG